MKKWEYCLSDGASYAVSGLLGSGKLAELGREGWEAVGFNNSGMLLLKREKEEIGGS